MNFKNRHFQTNNFESFLTALVLFGHIKSFDLRKLKLIEELKEMWDSDVL